jgi:ribA/ribD-fused uncharacterized protein
MEKANYCFVNERVVWGFDSNTGYEFLSNFAPCPKKVVYDGLVYPTSEHAYQAAKFDDEDLRIEFTWEDVTVGKAKKLGRKYPMRSDWDKIKDRVMAKVVLDKFQRDEELAEKLLATDNRTLVEANHWNDTYWGVDKDLCRGQNKLGKTLMGVRSLLKMQRHPRTIYNEPN